MPLSGGCPIVNLAAARRSVALQLVGDSGRIAQQASCDLAHAMALDAKQRDLLLFAEFR